MSAPALPDAKITQRDSFSGGGGRPDWTGAEWKRNEEFPSKLVRKVLYE